MPEVRHQWRSRGDITRLATAAAEAVRNSAFGEATAFIEQNRKYRMPPRWSNTCRLHVNELKRPFTRPPLS